VVHDPDDPSKAGPWLPDPQEPDSHTSQRPAVPHSPAGRQSVAQKPVSPWLDEDEVPESEPERAFEQTSLWHRCNPIFSAVIAAGALCLVVAIAIMRHSIAAPKGHTHARPVQPAPVAFAPKQLPSGPMPSGKPPVGQMATAQVPLVSRAAIVRRSLWPIPEQGGVQGHYWATSFSPDGQTYLAFGDSGPRGVVRLWDVAPGKPAQEFRTGKDVWFYNAMYLPDGEHVVTAYTNARNLFLWDVKTGTLVHEFQGHTADGVTPFVSHDGRHLVSAGRDNTLRLWNVAERQEVWTQAVAGEQIATVAFSPDDHLILTSGADRMLRIRELETGKIVSLLEGHAAPCAGEFSPDGKHVLSWAEDGQIRLWDVGTADTLKFFDGRAGTVRKAWHLDGGRQVLTWGKDLVFRVWDAASGEKLSEITVAPMIPPGWTEATVSPDGRRLLVVNSDGDDVRLVDISSGVELYRSERGKFPMARGFSFSPDGRYVAAGSFRAGVYLVELPDLSAESPLQQVPDSGPRR